MGLDVSAAPRVLLGGGIGSGKSTIADVFQERGFTVIDADRVAADIISPGSDAAVAVAHRWPSVASNGVINRGALAQIVFADEDELRSLEAIVHPATAEEILRRVSENPGAVLVEIPLLHLDLPGRWYKVAVLADEEIRIARAVARGGDSDDIRRRLSLQASDDDWGEWADVVIENRGAWADTLRAAETVIEACT